MLAGLFKRILPPEDKVFYSLFDDSIELAHQAAILLNAIYREGMSDEKIEKAKAIKENSAEITHLALEKLNSTFITPLDREDIQTVAVFINKITKRIVRAIKNSKYYHLHCFNDHLKRQSALLVQITEELKNSVHHLRKSTQPKQLTISSNRLREIDNILDLEIKDAIESLFAEENIHLSVSSGDKLVHSSVNPNVKTTHDPLTIIKLGRLYRDIESVTEGCNNLSDIILNIVLKNS